MYTGPWGRVRKIWMEDGETRVSVPKWIVHVLLDSLDKEFILNTLLDEKKIEIIASTMNECLEQIIERLEAFGKYNSASKHKVALSLLRQYKSTPIRLDEIDTQFLNDFELFLRNRGNRNNSIATKFSILKATYNRAVEEGRFCPKSNPFIKFKVGKLWTSTHKRAIAKQHIILIENYSPQCTNTEYMARLKQENIAGGRLYYTRHKTGKLLSYKLMPKALEIIQRYQNPTSEYLFPILNSSHKTELQKFNRIHKALAKTNKALKQIGEELKIPNKLTTYVARHSYATVLRRAGVATSIISSSLGHSSEKVTQIYLDSFENKQIDEAMQHLV